jgi:hypothetical protein
MNIEKKQNTEESKPLTEDKAHSEKLPESRGDVADRAEEQIEATIQDKIAEIRRRVRENARRTG